MFLILFLILAPSTTGDWFNRFLRFPITPSVDNYVITRPNMEDMKSAFTICAWVMPWYTGNSYEAWLSYAAGSHFNEIVLSAGDKINHIYSSHKKVTVKTPATGSWNHQCVTWALSTLRYNVYLNGKLVATGTTVAGYTLTTGGVLVLGQEQDSLAGDFVADEAFGGRLYQLNMWSRAVEAGDVGDMWERGLCGGIKQELAEDITLPWAHFLEAQRFGDVRAVTGTCSLWELVRDKVDSGLYEHLVEYHSF